MPWFYGIVDNFSHLNKTFTEKFKKEVLFIICYDCRKVASVSIVDRNLSQVWFQDLQSARISLVFLRKHQNICKISINLISNTTFHFLSPFWTRSQPWHNDKMPEKTLFAAALSLFWQTFLLPAVNFRLNWQTSKQQEIKIRKSCQYLWNLQLSVRFQDVQPPKWKSKPN